MQEQAGGQMHIVEAYQAMTRICEDEKVEALNL